MKQHPLSEISSSDGSSHGRTLAEHMGLDVQLPQALGRGFMDPPQLIQPLLRGCCGAGNFWRQWLQAWAPLAPQVPQQRTSCLQPPPGLAWPRGGWSDPPAPASADSGDQPLPLWGVNSHHAGRRLVTKGKTVGKWQKFKKSHRALPAGALVPDSPAEMEPEAVASASPSPQEHTVTLTQLLPQG